MKIVPRSARQLTQKPNQEASVGWCHTHGWLDVNKLAITYCIKTGSGRHRGADRTIHDGSQVRDNHSPDLGPDLFYGSTVSVMNRPDQPMNNLIASEVIKMVGGNGLEPSTSAMSPQRSSQLS